MSALTLFQQPRQGTLSRNGWGGLFDTFFDDFTSFPRQTLTISYESSTGEGTNAVSYSSFTKSWTLPDGTTEKDISAGYDSGVLTVNVQKTEPVKIPVKTIPVQ